MTALHDLLTDLPEPDAASGTAVAARVGDILRPAGALRRLDEIAVWLAGWQGTSTPAVQSPAGLLFAADHGVAAADVSAYPADVTAAMVKAVTAGRSTFDALARTVGASVTCVDVGVGTPTGDIRHEPALSPERFDEIVATATTTVEGLDGDLLVLGELGIGNTTAAAAVVACCLGGSLDDWIGRGTGVDDAGMARKRDAVAMAVARIAEVDDPVETLRQVGGAELVALAAAIAAARRRRLPVVLDGYVVTAAALPVALASPRLLDHCLAGHVSAECGHRRVLDHLGLEPLLDLDLRLGEGSGAMAAVSLVAMACAAVNEVPTFTEWFGS